MGAYTPVSFADDDLLARVQQRIISPTLRTMAEDGHLYKGFLYVGLMISPGGDPFVVEFNCRLGDPEAQVVLPVLDDDLLDHLVTIASGGRWVPTSPRLSARGAAVTTVLAAEGYPISPRKGTAITIPTPVPDNTLLFHAGTAIENGVLRTSGGRVLCATGLGGNVPEAALASRQLADAVAFDGKVYRRDIAWREIDRAGVA
jgi:phosphoribosylamine--glycine ligase